MQRVRLETKIEIDDLPFPSFAQTNDSNNRPIKLRYDYTSIRVDYNVTYVGNTNTIDTFQQVITEI